MKTVTRLESLFYSQVFEMNQNIEKISLLKKGKHGSYGNFYMLCSGKDIVQFL